MTEVRVLFISGILALGACSAAFAQNVVEDGGFGLSYDELEYIVQQWTPQMQQSAADDVGDRLELLNVALANKKLAREAEKLSPDADSEAYWQYVFMIRGAQRNFILGEVAKNLEVPDMTVLAEERYQTQKEKYALVPEHRTSSHILFACAPGACSRVEAKAKAQVVLDKLRAGADFAEMVHEYSGDPGTRAKDGKFDKWMFLGEQGVTPRYSGGLFEIEEVGQYSDLVSTEFGVHIIRLDGIEEPYFKPYEEVKGAIIADLELEYRKLAMKDYLRDFNITDDAFIDGDAMEKIFSPYGTAEKEGDAGS